MEHQENVVKWSLEDTVLRHAEPEVFRKERRQQMVERDQRAFDLAAPLISQGYRYEELYMKFPRQYWLNHLDFTVEISQRQPERVLAARRLWRKLFPYRVGEGTKSNEGLDREV